MPAVPFRDRPVLEHIVEQHAEEAAFLWTLRDAATDAPHYKRHHLARLDERVEAHVDGLRVAGEAGWRIALEQLERRCEKGELFAAGVLALESGDMRRIEPLVARAQAEPEARRGFVGAIAWCRPALLAPAVRAWNASAEGFERYLALCACSMHRAETGSRLGALAEDRDALVRARALRLAGELGRVPHLGACLEHLNDAGDAAFWAAWSAVLLGDRGIALRTLGDAVLAGAPHRWTALEVYVRAAAPEHGVRFIRGLNGDGALRRTVVVALGHLGDPAAVPWLVERMGDAGLARPAGESFAMISGADLAYDDLERGTPPGEAMLVPGGGTADPEVVGDPDEHLPWPDPALVRSWWSREHRRFALGERHLLGRPAGAAACERAFRDGFQRQRRAAAFEAALARGDAELANWRRRQ
ncbi:MAG: TIGR02270 family protein [Acetobacteraceae bacterium]|nr:TIGR02270 family protein [Acetobacteraceae bacterium]